MATAIIMQLSEEHVLTMAMDVVMAAALTEDRVTITVFKTTVNLAKTAVVEDVLHVPHLNLLDVVVITGLPVALTLLLLDLIPQV